MSIITTRLVLRRLVRSAVITDNDQELQPGWQHRGQPPRTRRGLALAGLGLVTALLAPAIAPAATVLNERIPISGTFPNTCSGENVTFEGVAHFTFRVTDNGNSVHVGTHVNAHAEGVGQTSGDGYSLSETGNDHLNIAKGGNETFVLNSNVVSRGSTPNERVKCRFHITVNANGDVTATFSSLEFTCT